MHSQKDNPEKLATKTKKNKAKTQHNIHKNTGALLQTTGGKNWQHRLQRTNKNKTQYVLDTTIHKTNTDNVNKTCALLQTTEGLDEPNIV